MKLPFTKMHGAGNDFVVIDGISQNGLLSPLQIRDIADRHFGVGCDQLLLVEKAQNPEANFRYRIFNADGGEVYLALGWHLAFNGVVTYGSAAPVREAARLVPAERLVVETDSPYLAPVPYRGTRCEPAHAARTLGVLAEIRGVPTRERAEATTANAVALFRLVGS